MKKFNFYLGASASAWLLAVLVIASELSAEFKALLAGFASHHWIAKAIIITLAFLLVGYLLKKKNSIVGVSDEKIAWYSALGSLSVIFLFFIIEFVA